MLLICRNHLLTRICDFLNFLNSIKELVTCRYYSNCNSNCKSFQILGAPYAKLRLKSVVDCIDEGKCETLSKTPSVLLIHILYTVCLG